METVTYLAKKEAMAEKKVTYDSIIETIAKKDDESTTKL